MSNLRRERLRSEMLRVVKNPLFFAKQHFSVKHPHQQTAIKEKHNQTGAAAFYSVRFCLYRSIKRASFVGFLLKNPDGYECVCICIRTESQSMLNKVSRREAIIILKNGGATDCILSAAIQRFYQKYFYYS